MEYWINSTGCRPIARFVVDLELADGTRLPSAGRVELRISASFSDGVWQLRATIDNNPSAAQQAARPGSSFMSSCAT
jgi:hypothetical protein